MAPGWHIIFEMLASGFFFFFKEISIFKNGGIIYIQQNAQILILPVLYLYYQPQDQSLPEVNFSAHRGQ